MVLNSNFEEQMVWCTYANEAQIRLIRSDKKAAYYVPVQLNERVPLDYTDYLETDAPCLTIGRRTLMNN